MKVRVLDGLLALTLLAAVLAGGGAWAIDEAILTPTSKKIVAQEEKEFNDAMGVWMQHRYADGAKMLSEFAKKRPNSRWAAEADLHVGCYLTFQKRYSEARPIFEKLIAKHADSNICAKAKIRLGNVSEREGKFDEAIGHYTQALKTNPTWDQFKYANYHARKLIMTRGKRLAMINCGPVALAACLDAMGKTTEAEIAKAMKPSEDGLSLAALASEAETLGARAQTVELTVEDLKGATLPVLAHVLPNHYMAILAINGNKAQVEDSIRGKHEVSLDSLQKTWSGKALTFAPASNLKPLSMMAAIETVGGCCGQMDEDECTGICPEDCKHIFVSSLSSGRDWPGGGSDGGCFGCGTIRSPDSPGSPTWQINTMNLNLLVQDTPIWYNPGKGPQIQIAFTLTYSNENSNTGIFGRSWRSPYDMKVFFLPGYDEDHPDLQVHLDSGRIETYEYNDSQYNPRYGMAAYGYRKGYNPVSQTLEYIKILTADEAGENEENVPDGAGTVMLVLPGGGKYFFKKQGSGATVEGRIYIIQDDVGNRVTCSYTDGCLSSVTDANSNVTTITTTGSGINERVTRIDLPQADGRYAVFGYTDGNLTSVTDMGGHTSTLEYNALLTWGTQQFYASTTLTQAVTASPLVPANGGSLSVNSTTGFLSSGKIKVNNDEEMSYTSMTAASFTGITRGSPAHNASSGASVTQVVPETDLQSDITASQPGNGGDLNVVSTDGFPSSGWIAVEDVNTETINYTSKTSTSFKGITRGNPAYAAAAATTDVWLCMQTPYLSEIVTPSMKTKFTYAWVGNSTTGDIIGLHEVRECGPTESSYPGTPTISYSWTSYHTNETRYGNLMKTYGFAGSGFFDLITYVVDELGHTVAAYGYNYNRDRTSVTDGNGKTTTYTYSDHDMTLRTDPLNNTWEYTYTNHRVATEKDPDDNVVKAYTYNAAGQVTKIETELTEGVKSILVENVYDGSGRLIESYDGGGIAAGNKTTYDYNEGDETRGFLTSVHDPAGKETKYRYDDKGRRDQVTDPNENVTTYEFDDLDRVTKVTNPDETTVETEYTCCHKDRVVDENGVATRYVYDRKNRPWVTVSAAKDGVLAQDISESATSLPLSDASGFPTPPQGGYAVVVVQHKYATCPSGCYQYVGLEIMTYTGKNGNTLTGVTRAQYGSTAHAFNTDDRVTVGNVVVYGYESTYLNRMIYLKDALNHTTYYTYYDNEKLETIRYPDDTGERYSYDNAGNMTMKEIGSFDGGLFTTTKTIEYEYDANNRLVKMYRP